MCSKQDRSAPYSSAEVSQATGASLRVLQWWDEQGVICPNHNGHAREYTEQELRDVALVVDLRRRGVSLQRMRGLLNTYRKLRPAYPVDKYYFLTNGITTVKIATSPEEVITLLVKSKEPLVLLVIENA